MSIRLITATEAHPLRRAVLRKGMEQSDVGFPQDAHPDGFHLGFFNGDDLVGVATFSPGATPFRPDVPAWQLRGMAVADDQQGKGVGAALIAEAIARVRAAEASVLWCDARDSAASFYAKLGFVTHGDGFATKATGLPHHVMVLDL